MIDHNSSSVIASTLIWFLLGIFIFFSNIVTTAVMWKTKNVRKKDHPGIFPHGMWYLLAIDMSFSGLGLILTLNSLARFSVDNGLPKTVCDFFGFTIRFLYGFVVVTTLVILIDKIYCLMKPFKYYTYVRGKSKSPLIALLCCIICSFINGIFPLVNQGEYKETYSICVLTWDNQTSSQLIAFLNLLIALLMFGLILVIFWLRFKLHQKRRQMKVSLSRPHETIIFVLSISCLILVCWIPNIVGNFLTVYHEDLDLGDKGRVTLFGLILIPPLVNLFLTYFLHQYFQDQCKKCGLQSLKEAFPLKIKGCKMSSNTMVRTEQTTAQVNQTTGL